jgi:hypothetical protein
VAKKGDVVAKQGDGWLRREMSAQQGDVVAKQGDGWLSSDLVG